MVTDTVIQEEAISEGFRIIEVGLNAPQAIKEAAMALRKIKSENLNKLAKLVLTEVARRGINDKDISPRVYVAAELLLFKEG